MIKSKTKIIGIIGGSGLDDPKILKDSRQKTIKTKYGSPSSKLTVGRIGSHQVVILARHGYDHSIPPTKVPYRANIMALKKMGCEEIIATTACGSLRVEYKPGDLVFLDQFIDMTKLRKLSFFDNKVVHTPMAEPFDKDIRKRLIKMTKKHMFRYHSAGTMLTIEGPRFSTIAESKMFRQWGADLINMSTVPEVVLANELKIPYQSIAMVTDYDCWKENEESVTFELILKRMEQNADKVKKVILNYLKLA
jgi:5'-methylthioadenosine phosphorylase